MNRAFQLAIAASALAILLAVVVGFMAMRQPPLEADESDGSAPESDRRSDATPPSAAPPGPAPTSNAEPPPNPAHTEDAAVGDTAADDTAALANERRGEAVPQRSIWPASREGIQGAVAESIPGVLDCYDGWLEQNPDLSGRIEVRFEITPSEDPDELARITAAEIADSTVGHTFMEGCVLSVMEELRFETDEAVAISYPFIFKNEGE